MESGVRGQRRSVSGDLKKGRRVKGGEGQLREDQQIGERWERRDWG